MEGWGDSRLQYWLPGGRGRVLTACTPGRTEQGEAGILVFEMGDFRGRSIMQVASQVASCTIKQMATH